MCIQPGIIPETKLITVDGVEASAIKLIPNADTLESALKKDKTLLRDLEYSLFDGTLHQFAYVDWVLGNPDRHGQNVLYVKNPRPLEPTLRLIDHSSAMASAQFNPSVDQNSFVPFYLRMFTKGQYKNALPVEKKRALLPRTSELGREYLRSHISGTNLADLEAAIEKYGIDSKPMVHRLKALQALAQVESVALDELITQLWT